MFMYCSTQLESVKEPLISIIIPVYNSAKYIAKCLNSVIVQSFKNIEIICVDDASTDKSLKLLQTYAMQDNRIRVFSNEINMGAGYSRNFALDNASGKYIYFLDSDDWLFPEGLTKLVNTLEKYGEIDVIAFLHCRVNATTHLKQDFPPTPENLTNRIVNIYNTPESIQYLGYGMTKIIRKNLLLANNIKFNNDKCFEDVGHFLDLIPTLKSIVFINEKIFNYRISRKGSIISKGNNYIEYLIKDTCKAEELSKNLPVKTKAELLKKIYSTLAYTALLAYANFKISHSELKNIFNKYIDYDVLEENDMKYYIYVYNKVMNSPKIIFTFENLVKMKIKELFPTYFERYMSLKSLFRKK